MALELISVTHVNINCSDLERSLAFYQNHVALTPQSHTNPLPQDGAGFGLPGKVVWDAHLLHDDRGQAGPALDLLEWKNPKPVGQPAADANQLGFFRLCLTHPDLDALHAELESAGIPCRSKPVSVPVVDGHEVRFFCCADPDGTCIEFVEREGPRRLSHININCRDLDVSSRWYQEVLGVQPIADRAEPPMAAGAGFGWEQDCDYRADFLAVGGRADSLILDLLEWKTPRPIGKPSAEANHLGLFRMAFAVADAAACCAELDRLGIEHSGACWLEMGPEIPIAGLNAVFFRDPDGTMLELIEVPELLSEN